MLSFCLFVLLFLLHLLLPLLLLLPLSSFFLLLHLFFSLIFFFSSSLFSFFFFLPSSFSFSLFHFLSLFLFFFFFFCSFFFLFPPSSPSQVGPSCRLCWRRNLHFVNPTEYSLCREHYYGGHSEGPGGVLLKVWILAKKSTKSRNFGECEANFG